MRRDILLVILSRQPEFSKDLETVVLGFILLLMVYFI